MHNVGNLGKPMLPCWSEVLPLKVAVDAIDVAIASRLGLEVNGLKMDTFTCVRNPAKPEKDPTILPCHG